MRLIAIAILAGAVGIAATLALKPTGFERCVSIVFSDIDRQASSTGTTLDPRDMEAQAARTCAGQPPQ